MKEELLNCMSSGTLLIGTAATFSYLVPALSQILWSLHIRIVELSGHSTGHIWRLTLSFFVHVLGLCDNENSYITIMELIITITVLHKVHLGSYGSELCNARISCHILSPLPFTVIPVLVRCY